jgi:hypothetical protein
MHGQPLWAGRAIAARERGAWRCGASMWVLMIVLASCQDVAEQPAQIEPVTFDPAYPSLHTVPARPQLSYTVEQRRAIVDMLIADRANARYTEEVVRYRAGLSSEPPPAAPALAAVSPNLAAPGPDGAHATTPPDAPRAVPAIIPETKFQTEDGSLDSFMRDMVSGRAGPQRPANPAPAGRPDANAGALGTGAAGAGATELIAQAAAYPPRSQAVILAMPPDPASLPPPRPAPPLASTEAQDLASLGAQYKSLPPPPPDTPTLAGRAPGAVWGAPDMAPGPADGPLAMLADAVADAGLPRRSDLPPAEPALAERAPGVVWGMPDMAPAPAATPTAQVAEVKSAPRAGPMVGGSHEPAHAAPAVTSAPAAIEPLLAGRAPGAVWGIPDRARAAAPTTQAAEVEAGSYQGPEHGAPPESFAPGPNEPRLAGRAPGVVWGMPDMAPTPAGPAAARPASRVVQPMPLPGPVNPAAAPAETVLAGQAGTPAQTTPPSRQPAPPMPAPAKPAPPAAAVTLLAGAAPEGAGGRAEQTSAAVPAALALLPAPAKPTSEGNAIETGPPTMAVADRPTQHPVSRPAAGRGIALTDGLVAIDVATSRDRDAALGSIPFRPESAMLTPDAVVLLAQFLNGAEAPAARIRIVGEAAAPALALDRARAVGLALVQGGVAADRLELTLAHGGSGDQARLFLAAPEL